MSLHPDAAFAVDLDPSSLARIRTSSATTVRPTPPRILDSNLLPTLISTPPIASSYGQAISASRTLQQQMDRPHSRSDASSNRTRLGKERTLQLGAPFDPDISSSPYSTISDNSSSSGSGSGKTIRLVNEEGRRSLSHKRSWSDPYASIPILPTISATTPTSTPTPAHASDSDSAPPSRPSASHQVTTRVSFANDPLVRRRSQKQLQRHRASGSTPPVHSISTTSTLPPSTWPRSALKTPSSQAPSPDTVASSLSPQTPQSPLNSFVPFTDSPMSRWPRHHNSFDTSPGAAPFPALPFTSTQQPRTSKLLEQKQRKSSPGLLTAYELNATPASTINARNPSPEASQPPPFGRREVTSSNASKASLPIWQTKVAEELVRLSRNRSQSPELEVSQKSSSSTGKENSYRPRKRSQPTAGRQRKLSSLFQTHAAEVEPVIVHVVSQESYDGGIDPYAIPSESVPTPLMDDDGVRNPFHLMPGSGKPHDSDTKKSSSSESSQGEKKRPGSSKRRQRKAKVTPSRDGPEGKGGSNVVASVEESSHVTVVVASTPRIPGSTPISTSLPSMRARTPPPTASSSALTFSSHTLRPSPKSTPILRPSTPTRPRTISELTPSSSPGDSPRRRLNSSIYEGSLFFTPRAAPPEGYVGPPSSTSSPLKRQTSSSSVSYPSRRTTSALVPGQVRLIAQEEGRREEEAASLGKGKGKRLGSDDEDDGGSLFSALEVPIQARQRKESVMTTDGGDVLGELPSNPRKRIKLTTSAALVQSLADAADAGEREQRETRSRSRSPGSELRGILTNKGSRPPSEDVQDYNPVAGPSRPDSRRSGNVSFVGGETPPASPSTSRGRSRPSSMSSGKQSIPLMALITPRPASMSMSGYEGGYHLKEPKRYASPSHSRSPVRAGRSTSSALGSLPGSRTFLPTESSSWYHALPMQGWAFFAGFLLPVFWWIAALSSVQGPDTERAEFANLHTPDRE
ncbi:hypothetical protein FRB96_009067 [Tulasnella sp. 330]|nr:hypothetical protein FRB96_009067 [Tulasnella sp. 330]KAG8875274.1 hypothetical protein FRB97_005251 [Tulasnella sp. 331]KAG8881348.1 hypothetical protein FRB98_004392 [Tulasnella sp. 332]